MPEYKPGNSADRSKLKKLVEYFEKLMNEIAKPDIPSYALPAELHVRLLPRNLHPQFVSAWDIARRRIENLLAKIAKAPNDSLKDHGLLGKELTFKLDTVAHFSHILFVNPVREALRKLLEVMDVVFESLFPAVGVHNPLVEIKKMVERLL